jgi:CheY-like chemotaxis protein
VRMKSILLVEDSRFLRLANEKALVRAGYSVVTASDGEEALRIAFARIPDLILLDMLLPKLGGAQVLHALRNNALTALIPVIVLSSLPQANESKLKKEGATAYFEKSKLELDQHSESLIHIVKRTLDGLAEHKNQTAPLGAGISLSLDVSQRQT